MFCGMIICSSLSCTFIFLSFIEKLFTTPQGAVRASCRQMAGSTKGGLFEQIVGNC